MLGYSVIIPQRDCGAEVRRQLPSLSETLAQLGRPFEIIIVDDGSTPATQRMLDKLLGEHQSLRLLRLDAPCGASVALSAGIASARGEVLMAIEPGDRYPVGQIPALVHWLNRADLIVGRRRRSGIPKLWHRISRIPRGLLLGLESHDPDCLFWAARREVVAGVNLTAGMGRYLPGAGIAARLPRVRNVRGKSRRAPLVARCSSECRRLAGRVVVVPAVARKQCLRIVRQRFRSRHFAACEPRRIGRRIRRRQQTQNGACLADSSNSDFLQARQERMTIFFSAGEPSGDLHGANLIRQLRRLRPEVKCVGYGGPEMAAAGCELHADLTVLAVMWFLRALLNLHKFLALASRADRYFRHQRPDAVVLIDYPGFNWWIARRAKAHGIPVFYYCPPQIWAWGSWRIKKMRRSVDHVLCALPFEATWFRRNGCRATFVGHPFFDEVRRLSCRPSRRALRPPSDAGSRCAAPPPPSADPTCRSRTAARRARRTPAARASAVRFGQALRPFARSGRRPRPRDCCTSTPACRRAARCRRRTRRARTRASSR